VFVRSQAETKIGTETMLEPSEKSQHPADSNEINSLIAELAGEKGKSRWEARLALVKIGKPAVAALVQALKGPRERVRWEAAKALSQIGDPTTAPELVVALEDESFGVRWLAAEGLIAAGHNGLEPLLRALMHHSDSVWLRAGAHHILRTLAGDWELHEEIAPVLAALEDIEPAIEVPPAAQAALISLTRTRGEPNSR
jgi:HEAT repeat protein